MFVACDANINIKLNHKSWNAILTTQLNRDLRKGIIVFFVDAINKIRSQQRALIYFAHYIQLQNHNGFITCQCPYPKVLDILYSG